MYNESKQACCIPLSSLPATAGHFTSHVFQYRVPEQGTSQALISSTDFQFQYDVLPLSTELEVPSI
jgi:hypothetical protein